VRMLSRILLLSVAVPLFAAGCSRPDFSESNKGPISAESAPDLPVWARRDEGHPLASVGGERAGCVGYVDGVSARFSGSRPGARVGGWGWDSIAKKPFPKIVITSSGSVVGAGSSGVERTDVPKVIPAVTSEKTGWTAIAHIAAGGIEAWGLTGSNVCLLGRFELK
jgi:hypothetical protein